MALVIEERSQRNVDCGSCGVACVRVQGYVLRDGNAHAVYFAACHGHPEHEALIDVTLGSWGDGADHADHHTFSCVLRSDGAMAVDAPAATLSDAPVLGRRLARGEALGHPWVASFWEVVDLVAEGDPTVSAHVYARRPTSGSEARPDPSGR